jgi:SWIM zinc finger
MSSLPIRCPALQVVSPPDPYLTLTIQGQVYDLTPLLDCDPCIAVRACQLRKLPLAANDPAPVYHVRQAPQGWTECDCPDATFRGRDCKHARALIALGLLDRPRRWRA